jgi:hypothetical protein
MFLSGAGAWSRRQKAGFGCGDQRCSSDRRQAADTGVSLTSLNINIVEDIRRVAHDLGQGVLSRAEYVQKGKFALYQIEREF